MFYCVLQKLGPGVECEKCGVWFCPLGGTAPKDPTPDPDSPGLTSKHRVWFCPLGGTGSSPGLTRTKLLQDTIKQYPGLCASFFLNTIPYYPSKLSQTIPEEHLLTRYPDKNLDKILPAMSQSCLQDFGQDLARGPLGQYRDMS